MKNSYSAKIREELVRRGLSELGIPEKGKERLRPCCAESFLRGAFLCAGERTGTEIVLASGHGELKEICRHILRRYYKTSDELTPLSCPPEIASALSSERGKDANMCEDCRKLFLRAVFLACGTVSDPAKDYRAVFRCKEERIAREIQRALTRFSLNPGESCVKDRFLVYLKRGEEICDLLVAIGDQRHAIQLQERMVETSFRSAQNRRQNSDLANVRKAVDGAQSVIAAIRYLSDKGAMSTLSDPLREAARIRLENPDMTLKELCLAFPGSISKSGLNHRLQKLSAIARELKEKEKQK